MDERSLFERRFTVAVLVIALGAGIALTVGFLRFDALHKDFLAANFDSVHGARTVLKARYFLGQAEERVARAAAVPSERQIGRAHV